MIAWSHSSFLQISDTVNEAFLGIKGKKNLRQLTKSDIADLESLKIDVLTNIPPNAAVSAEQIVEHLSDGSRSPMEFREALAEKGINTNNMNIETYRQHVIGLYIEYFSGS